MAVRAWLPLLLPALALAGCTAPEGEPLAPADAAPPSPDPADGGDGAAPPQPQGTPPAEAVPPAPAAPALAVLPVQESGKLSHVVGVVHTGLVTGWERWFGIEAGGSMVAGNLTLTWDPGTTGPGELLMAFGPTEDIEGGERLKEGFVEARGASPLVLAFDGQAWEEGRFAVAVAWANFPEVATEQPFEVAGELRYRPAAP